MDVCLAPRIVVAVDVVDGREVATRSWMGVGSLLGNERRKA